MLIFTLILCDYFKLQTKTLFDFCIYMYIYIKKI